MLGGILALVAPAVLGSWLVRRLPRRGERPPGPGLTASMGLILGLGLASVLSWWAISAGVPLAAWRWVELGALALAAGVAARWIGGGGIGELRGGTGGGGVSPPGGEQQPVQVSTRLSRVIGVVALSCLGAAVAAMVVKVVLCRHGEWDAWAIWNLHARFIFRETSHSLGYLDAVMDWTHPDYPLLVPLSVVRGWTLNNGESTIGPALLGPVYMLAGAGLVTFGLARHRGRVAGHLALVTLLAAPGVSQNAAAQLADTPLWANVLLGVVCCWLGALEDRPRYLLLGGVAAGLAAWTKNEGLFMVLALAGVLLPALTQRSWRRALGQAGWLAGGLLPGMVNMVLFWRRVGGYSGGTLGALTPGQALVHLTTPMRHWAVASRYLLEPLSVRVWGVAPWLLALVPLVLGLDRDRTVRQAALGVGATAVALHAAQYLMFVVIPGDQTWLLDSALHRLLLHGFPTLVLVIWSTTRRIPDHLT